MKIALGILMILHGIAHLPGFLVPWRLMKSREVEYKTTVLGGHVDLGDGGVRLLGALWLLMAAAFVLGGIATLAGMATWPVIATSLAAFSLILSLLSLPEAKIGLVLNASILVVMGVGRWNGWW